MLPLSGSDLLACIIGRHIDTFPLHFTKQRVDTGNGDGLRARLRAFLLILDFALQVPSTKLSDTASGRAGTVGEAF